MKSITIKEILRHCSKMKTCSAPQPSPTTASVSAGIPSHFNRTSSGRLCPGTCGALVPVSIVVFIKAAERIACLSDEKSVKNSCLLKFGAVTSTTGPAGNRHWLAGVGVPRETDFPEKDDLRMSLLLQAVFTFLSTCAISETTA